MPIIKSARKRVRVAQKATVRNLKTKRSLKNSLKTFQSGKKSAEAFNKAQSALDKAGKHGVIHKNKVARKKRQLAAKAKAAGIKPNSVKKPIKKPVTVKRATAKKPAAAKKIVTKKPAAKNPVSKKTSKK